ncbi:Kinase-like protein [Mycena venus]|uniref:Kinase-like protein n=1 Tax=Mycena venus TaxID=2733690 RepID=A0A8H6TZZ3_9AGAR|nr:Kinase-like protein [Mycena venus]
MDAVTSLGAGFNERNRTLMQVLEHLATKHPSIGVLVVVFKALIILEMNRRTNDPKVMALLGKVQDTLTVFVQVFSLVHTESNDNAALVERLSGIIASMSEEVRNCGNICDEYYTQSFVGKYINKGSFYDKFKEMGQQFEERRRNLEMVLLIRLTADPLPLLTDTSSDSHTSSSATTINVSRTPSVESLSSKQYQSAEPQNPVVEEGIGLVNAFLVSHDQRTTLLAQGLPASDLREALHSCEQRVCTSLLAVLGSRDAKRAVVLLKGNRAQDFLDAAQGVLDRGSLPNAEHTSRARRLIIRLSEARDRLPSSLFITGITNHDEHPTFSGGFGDIYRASFNGVTVALKRIRMFQASADSSPRSRLQFCREALVWQTLRHKYVLPLIGIDRETFSSSASLCMVSPWMQNGTVLKYLNEHGRVDVDKLLLQIGEGLAYLHSMKIVHGDLRGTNILVTDDWTACLADFGLTGVIEDTASTTGGALTSTANHAGSLRWFAPELIAPTFFGCDRFVRTTASDVYAFACVCLELHTGSPPFLDVSPDVAAMLKVVAGERPSRPASMSDNLWDLVTAAWAQKFQDRPSVDKIIESMKTLSEPRD